MGRPVGFFDSDFAVWREAFERSVSDQGEAFAADAMFWVDRYVERFGVPDADVLRMVAIIARGYAFGQAGQHAQGDSDG